ncbi:MAG: hypothetical protein COB54_05855 [Alphaproteobacteria bacterium]|nr:MAG: hypothetical protein COB54_05855 [Alphaproteobacteria bacterium]
MKVTTNAHNLSSLNSLIDPAQRQLIQDQQNDLRQNQDQKTAEQTSKVARQDRIDANRTALKKLQDRLKADNIEKLKAEFGVEKSAGQESSSGVNLNLRENLGSSTGHKPIDTRPGQIIDILV